MSDHIALVIVSHSPKIAEGTKELAAAMATDIHIGAAGGNPAGGLGSDFDLIESTVNEALEASGGKGVVVLTDLGSATLTVDSVVDFADDPDLIRYAPGPIVEGAVAAAVASAQGDDLDAVVASVADAAHLLNEEAGGSSEVVDPEGAIAEAVADVVVPGATGAFEAHAVVADLAGLHARPAAELAKLAATYPCDVRVNDLPATSILSIITKGIKHGDTVTVSSQGEDAERAVKEVAAAISAGFD